MKTIARWIPACVLTIGFIGAQIALYLRIPGSLGLTPLSIVHSTQREIFWALPIWAAWLSVFAISATYLVVRFHDGPLSPMRVAKSILTCFGGVFSFCYPVLWQLDIILHHHLALTAAYSEAVAAAVPIAALGPIALVLRASLLLVNRREEEPLTPDAGRRTTR